MKTLIESKKDWDVQKTYYKNTRGVSYSYEDGDEPTSFPCVLVLISTTDFNSYDTHYKNCFIYLSDFQE